VVNKRKAPAVEDAGPSKKVAKETKAPKEAQASVAPKSAKAPKEAQTSVAPKSAKVPKETEASSAPKNTKESPKLSPASASSDSQKLAEGIENLLGKDFTQETEDLTLNILKVKQELEEVKESAARKERREKEYFRPSFGDPVGPGNRLLVEEELGQGAYSTVYRARDLKGPSDREYAVKFIRKNPTLRAATEREVKLMRRLRLEASELDPEGASNFLGLAGPEVFEHDGHLALCFQLQKCDLRHGLKHYGQGGGLPLASVRSYARNIFMALRALKMVNVIHSDVKPDNLLLSRDRLSVKLSDFGCAMSTAEKIHPQRAAESVQPRFYRAPEVILGQDYSTPIDVWGAGCTLFEMANGNFLFTGGTNSEMLSDMMKHVGAFSRRFCGTGLFSTKHFRREDGALCLWDGGHHLGRERFPRPARPLLERLQKVCASDVALKAFEDLILSCVTPDPAVRADPTAALASTFLRRSSK